MRTTTGWMLCGAAFCAVTATTQSARADATFDVNEWMSLRFGGDFRIRNELDIERTNPDLAPRYRPRIRARAAAGVQFIEQFDVGFRAVTGNPEDSLSTHQTLTDGFSSWALSLDRAYLKWTPKSLGGSYAIAGKFQHPFYKRPVYGHMLWDDDVQPAGAAVLGRVPIGEVLEAWQIVGAAFYYQQNSEAIFGGEDASGEDGILLAGQTSFDFAVMESVKLTAGAGIHHLPDPTPAGSDYLFGRNQGNATEDLDGDGLPDEFVEDFTVIDSLLGVKWRGDSFGIDLGAQFIVNVGAEEENIGYGVGGATPITLCRGHSELKPYLDFQVMEREAIFSAWGQNDNMRTVEHRAIIAGIRYRVREWAELHPWVITSQDLADTAKDWTVRTRVDLNLKF